MALSLIGGLFLTSCDDVDPLVDSLEFDRLFAPTGLASTITNSTTVNLTWKSVEGVESYAIEIYKDSLEFDATNLVYTTETTSASLSYTLLSDTRYSARVKATSSLSAESKWYNITFLTEVPDIFLTEEMGDISANEVIMRWPVGTDATKITLTPTSGSAISIQLTDQDIASGIVTVTELAANTRYTAVLYSGTQKISKREVTTLKAGTIVLDPSDDLVAAIAAASSGSALLLKPGEYITDGSKVTIDKNISISGYNENNRPVIHAHFEIGNNVSSFELKYVFLEGTKSSGILDHVIQFVTSGTNGNISISGCKIDNYNKSLIAAASSIQVSVDAISIDNSIISNILTNSADCIDIRAGLIKNLSLTNSTFYNCAPTRDFIRLDDASANFPGQTSKISVDYCTFDRVANAADKSLLSARFTSNTISISNSIVSNSLSTLVRYALSSQPTCSKNNYYNASACLGGATAYPDAKYDISGNHTSYDPSYTNAASGDFTVNNSAVSVGDPRWIK